MIKIFLLIFLIGGIAFLIFDIDMPSFGSKHSGTDAVQFENKKYEAKALGEVNKSEVLGSKDGHDGTVSRAAMKHKAQADAIAYAQKIEAEKQKARLAEMHSEPVYQIIRKDK